ncbi:MAG TPA: hypothetical protein VF637_04150, partial [Sphingomicrobium sp.]
LTKTRPIRLNVRPLAAICAAKRMTMADYTRRPLAISGVLWSRPAGPPLPPRGGRAVIPREQLDFRTLMAITGSTK